MGSDGGEQFGHITVELELASLNWLAHVQRIGTRDASVTAHLDRDNRIEISGGEGVGKNRRRDEVQRSSKEKTNK